jgi:hypothetical protein
MSHRDALNLAHDERRPFLFLVRFNATSFSVHPFYLERLPR